LTQIVTSKKHKAFQIFLISFWTTIMHYVLLSILFIDYISFSIPMMTYLIGHGFLSMSHAVTLLNWNVVINKTYWNI